MAKTASKGIESVGWIFWMVVFAILFGPLTYVIWRYTYQTASFMVPISLGLVGAALGAGFVSWGVNSLIQRKVERQHSAQRKKSKKRK